jgi:hypothetical protein
MGYGCFFYIICSISTFFDIKVGCVLLLKATKYPHFLGADYGEHAVAKAMAVEKRFVGLCLRIKKWCGKFFFGVRSAIAAVLRRAETRRRRKHSNHNATRCNLEKNMFFRVKYVLLYKNTLKMTAFTPHRLPEGS